MLIIGNGIVTNSKVIKKNRGRTHFFNPCYIPKYGIYIIRTALGIYGYYGLIFL